MVTLISDLHVALLALCLRREAKQIFFGCSITGQHIAPWSDDNIQAERNRSPVGVKWKEHCCNIAMCGVGTFTDGHRFYEFIKRNLVTKNEQSTPQDNNLVPLIDDLRRIYSLCEKHRIDDLDYIPVGDICNHLLYIPPPSGSLSGEQEIRTAISSVNKKLLNVSWDQFCEIDKIIVLSGTRKKAATVLELIENRAGLPKRLNIHAMYIDKDAALNIINLLERRHQRR